MAIGTSFGLNLGYQQIADKNKDKKTNEDSKYMTAIPNETKIKYGNKNTVPQSTVSTPVVTTPKQEPVLQKPIKSYIIKPENPSTKYSWLDKEEEKYLDTQLDKSGLQGAERKALQDMAYRNFMDAKQAKAFLSEREQTKQSLVNGDSGLDKTTADTMYRKSQYADMIRTKALENGVLGITNSDDDEIIAGTISQRPELQGAYDKFIAGDLNELDMQFALGGNEIYRNDWENLKKENPNVAKLYTTKVEGDSLISQGFDIISQIAKGERKTVSDEEAFNNYVTERNKSLKDIMFKDFGAAPSVIGGAVQGTANLLLTPVNAIRGDTKVTDAIGEGMKDAGIQQDNWFGAGKFVAENGLPMLAAGGAGALTRSVLGATAKSGITQLAKSATIGAIEGAAAIQASKMASKGEFANAKETAVGALIGGAIGAKWKGAFVKSEKAIGDYILQGIKKGDIAKRARYGGLTEQGMGRIENVLGKAEKKIVSTVKNIINPKATTVRNTENLLTAASKEASKLRNGLSKIEQEIPFNDIAKRINNIEPPISVKSDKVANNTYNAIKDKVLGLMEKNKKNPIDILDFRQQLDDIAEKEFPGIWKNQTQAPLQTAVKSIRTELNTIVDDYASSVGKEFKPGDVLNSLGKQTDIYHAVDMISPMLEGVGTTTLSRFAQRRRELLKALGLLVGGAIGSRGVSATVGGGTE